MGLDLVELIMDLELEFSISIPDEQVGACRTVGDLIELVQSVVPARDPRDVAERVRRFVANAAAMKPEQISDEQRLVEDLGLGS